MSLRVEVAGQKERNKNYFTRGCVIKRIKPNSGILSTRSAPHDKIWFCLQAEMEAPWPRSTPRGVDAATRAQHIPSQLSSSLVGSCPLVHNGQLCAAVQTKWTFSGDTRSWTEFWHHQYKSLFQMDT